VRIAIFGGTFDPIHNGHLAAAESVVGLFDVDELHFVPSFAPPHKPAADLTSPFHRFAMTAIATAPYARFRASTMELDTLACQYMVDTLDRMARLNPEDERLFVMGTDMYAEIESWKDYRRLFQLAHFAVINRPGSAFRREVAAFTTLEEHAGVNLPASPRVFHIPFVEQPISSTRIRNEWDAAAVRQWVPPTVRGYIEKHKLYPQAGS
jgi:nicotinate-nucleotide adenylyltransferase